MDPEFEPFDIRPAMKDAAILTKKDSKENRQNFRDHLDHRNTELDRIQDQIANWPKENLDIIHWRTE